MLERRIDPPNGPSVLWTRMASRSGRKTSEAHLHQVNNSRGITQATKAIDNKKFVRFLPNSVHTPNNPFLRVIR
jgi:hypothetical protein